jgi:peroxiredoxin
MEAVGDIGMSYRTVLVAAILTIYAAVGGSAQTTAPQPAAPPLPDVLKLGPQIGARVPEFTLLDQNGQSRTLASLMGPKGLMLVFYRSADWCPYCKTQLAELQTRTADLAKSGIGLAAISYDSVAILADFSRRRGITFPLLSDPGSATIKRYGILNTTVPESNQQADGIPFPGTFVLNTQAVVTSRFFEPAYQERTTVGSIMTKLGNNVEVRAVTHLVSAIRDLVVLDRQHRRARHVVFTCRRCATGAGNPRVRARCRWQQADRALAEDTTGRARAAGAVSAERGLPLQATERTRPGLSETVSNRSGPCRRFVAGEPVHS